MTTREEIVQHAIEEEVREKNENRPKKFSIVGLNFYNGVEEGEILELVYEPCNPHDKHAIRVVNMQGEKVGYIKKGHCPSNKVMWNRDMDFYYIGHRLLVKVTNLRKTHCLGEIVYIGSEKPTIDFGFNNEEVVEEVVEEEDNFPDEKLDDMIKFFKNSPHMVSILAKRL